MVSAASRIEARERKALLRSTMRARLAALDPALARAAAESVTGSVLGLPEVAAARGLLVCLSFGTELDTWGLVDRLLESGRRLYVPRTAVGDPRLHVHPYPCTLETLSFGLRQPVAGAPELAPEELDDTLDVALIAGLAFDRHGHRLGYGAGYFDRFLEARGVSTGPRPVGLAYELQVVETLPVEEHDVAMDLVVTEAAVRRSR